MTEFKLRALVCVISLAWFSANALVLDTSTGVLSQSRWSSCSVAIGSTALVAGGNTGSTTSTRVDVFDIVSRSWSTVSLGQSRSYCAAAAASNFAVFVGGLDASGNPSTAFDIFNVSSGAQLFSSGNLPVPRAYVAAGSCGTRAFFAGGKTPQGPTNIIDMFDATTRQWWFNITQLSQPRQQFAAAAVQSKLLFAGGQTQSGYSSVVDVLDCASLRWTIAQLGQARAAPASATINSKAIFAGGCENIGPYGCVTFSAYIDIYDASTNTWSSAMLSQARWLLGAASFASVAVFAGGYIPNYGFSAVVDVYDGHNWTVTSLSVARGDVAGAAVAGTAVLAGGSAGAHSGDGTWDLFWIHCPIGFLANSSNICKQCSAGKFASPGLSTCSACLPGSFSVSAAQSSCLTCPQGSYCPSVGMTTSLLAPGGYYAPQSGMTTYYSCPTGSYCAAGSIAPTICAAGTFCPLPRLAAAFPCSAGFFCPDSGMTSQPIPCASMSISGVGFPACSPCPTGSVPSPNRTLCINTNYSCAPGFGKTSSFGCAQCLEGKFSDGSAACSICAANTYSNANGTVKCLLCTDPGLDCNPSTGLASPLPGFWSYQQPDDLRRTLFTVRCTNPSLCLGPSPEDHSSTLCDPTRLQSSSDVECAECIDSYSEWNGRCVKCTSSSGGLLLLVFIGSWVYVIITHHLSQGSSSLVSVFMYFVQNAVLMAGSAALEASVSWLTIFVVHPEDSGGGSVCIAPISSLGKLGLSLAVPFVFLAELGLSFAVHYTIGRSASDQRLLQFVRTRLLFKPSAYGRTFLALLLYSYTSLTSTTISFLDCIDIGSARVLAQYPAVDCSSAAYLHIRPLFVLVLAVSLAFPVALTVFLRYQLRREDLAKPSDAAWMILIQPYKPSAYLWHIVILIRRTIYVAFTTVASIADRGLAFCLLTMGCMAMQYRAKPFVDRTSNRLEFMSLTLHGALAALLARYGDPYATPVQLGSVLLVSVPAAVFLAIVVATTAREAWASYKQKYGICFSECLIVLCAEPMDKSILRICKCK